MEKRRKSGTAHYFFLVYIIMRRESVMLGSRHSCLSYRNNGKNRNIKVNEQCRKEKWVQFSLSLSGHGF